MKCSHNLPTFVSLIALMLSAACLSQGSQSFLTSSSLKADYSIALHTTGDNLDQFVIAHNTEKYRTVIVCPTENLELCMNTNSNINVIALDTDKNMQNVGFAGIHNKDVLKKLVRNPFYIFFANYSGDLSSIGYKQLVNKQSIVKKKVTIAGDIEKISGRASIPTRTAGAPLTAPIFDHNGADIMGATPANIPVKTQPTGPNIQPPK